MKKKKTGKVPRTKPKSSPKEKSKAFDKKPPSRFLSERMHRTISKLTKNQDFKNLDEANQFLEKHVTGKNLDDLLENQDYDPVEEAQELAFEAMETNDPAQMILYALEALVLDPNCIDALVLSADITSPSDHDLIDKLKLIINRAEKAMGEDFIEQNRGQFWGMVETRPYMRALSFLAETLQNIGNKKEAIRQYEKILELNPHDNQGIRYILIGLYLERKNLAKVRKLFKEYGDEPSAFFLWSRVLERFLSKDLEGAKKALYTAKNKNPYVQKYLTGQKSIPDKLPFHYSPGEESEAVVCAEEIGQAWKKHPDAIKWIESIPS